jgi:hypothetical protein
MKPCLQQSLVPVKAKFWGFPPPFKLSHHCSPNKAVTMTGVYYLGMAVPLLTSDVMIM